MTTPFGKILAFSAGLVLIPALAVAHHSTSEFAGSEIHEIEGEVVEFTWRNPHVIVKIAAVEDGVEKVYSLEGSSVSSQRRRGLSPDVLSVGDQVRAAGLVSSRDSSHMTLEHLLLPSGTELLLRNTRSGARWDTGTVLGQNQGIDPDKAAAAQSDGIFRVWTWGRLERGWWYFRGPEHYSLTDSAAESLAGYSEYEDNPVLKCIPPGMPATVGNPYPIEFVRAGDNIELHAEEFDLVRTIHMDGEVPADFEPRPLGFSVGSWEDENVLAIRTTHIDTPYFDRVGIPLGADAVVEERWSVDDANGRLDYEMRVTAPDTLAEPFEWRALWVWNPGEEVGEYDCLVAEG